MQLQKRERWKSILTSLAPASLSNFIIGPIVLPLTIESSIKTIFFPLTFSERAPNFLATPNCRSLVLGWMKVLPTYLFLHNTSANGMFDWKNFENKINNRQLNRVNTHISLKIQCEHEENENINKYKLTSLLPFSLSLYLDSD